MKSKIFELLSKFSNDLSENEQLAICQDLAGMQRSFKWDEWQFGLELFDRVQFIPQLSKANLMRVFALITELEKSNKSFFSRIYQSSIIEELISSLQKKIEEPLAEKNDTFKIDGTFDFRADTAPNKDPDQHSATLRKYHKLLWSKPLPNGQVLNLSDDVSGKYLYHKSGLGEFILTSDAITHSYKDTMRMKNVLDQMEKREIQDIYNSFQSIGGYTLFPGGARDGVQTINQARGCNRKIVDRFDLTLECVRRYYKKIESPLKRTFEGYSDFFALFETFEQYVEFFHFQDLVSKDFAKIKFFLPFDDSFPSEPFPKNLDEYHLYIKNTLLFITKRTERLTR